MLFVTIKWQGQRGNMEISFWNGTSTYRLHWTNTNEEIPNFQEWIWTFYKYFSTYLVNLLVGTFSRVFTGSAREQRVFGNLAKAEYLILEYLILQDFQRADRQFSLSLYRHGIYTKLCVIDKSLNRERTVKNFHCYWLL